MEWSHQELIPLDFSFQFFDIQALVQIQIRLLVPGKKVIIYKQNIYLCLLLWIYSIKDFFS